VGVVGMIPDDLDLSGGGGWPEKMVAIIEAVVIRVTREEHKNLLLNKLAGSLLLPRITILVNASTES